MNSLLNEPDKPKLNKPIGLLFLISVVWLLLNGTSLLIYPTITSDESLVGLVAYRQSAAGQQNPVSTYDPFSVYPFRLYLAGLTQWFNLFGIGLLQARAFSLLAGYVSGWLVFLLGRQLYDTTTGLLAGTLFWFSTHVFWASHYVRPEMWVTAANLSGLFLGWWVLKKPSVWLAIITGFLTTAILDVYLSTLSTTLTVGLVVSLWSVRHRQWSILAAFAVGCLLGLTYFAMAQFFPDWRQALTDWQLWISVTRRTGPQGDWVWANRLLAIPFSLFENYIRYSFIGWLELLYWVVASLWLIRRRLGQDAYTMVGAAAELGVYALAFAGWYHALDGWPLPVLMIAAGLTAIAGKLRTVLTTRLPDWVTPAMLTAVMAAPLLLSYLTLSVYYGWANREYDYVGYTNRLAQFTSPQASILGEGAWWWGFTNRPYWWDETLVVEDQLSLDDARLRVSQTMQGQAITTIFFDNNLGAMPYPGDNTVMRQALEEYLTNHCELQGEVNGTAYGIDFGGAGEKLTQVYHCDPN